MSMDRGAERTVKSTRVHGLRSCMSWPDWYQYLLQPHYCYFCICLHFTQDTWTLLSLLSSHACLLSPSGPPPFPPPCRLPSFAPHPFLGVHRDRAYQPPFPKHGKAPWQLGRLALATARHEKMPASCLSAARLAGADGPQHRRIPPESVGRQSSPPRLTPSRA